jgi:hypothetical protein
LITSTFADGTTPPEESNTRPVMAPVPVWAAAQGAIMARQTAKKHTNLNLIELLRADFRTREMAASFE